MDIFRHDRLSAVTIAVVAVLEGCSAWQPAGAPAAMPHSAARGADGLSDRSQIPPEAKRNVLIYVANNNVEVDIFSFPAGTLVASFSDLFPNSMCSDKAGNVFIINSTYTTVSEYPHGATTPSYVLQMDTEPNSCAVDPNTNNLAVTTTGSGPASAVAVFKNERGSPKYYEYTRYGGFLEQCSFDDRSNLFIRSLAGRHSLAELRNGAKSVESLKLQGSYNAQFLGAVQWDGKHMTIAETDYGSGYVLTIYRLAVNGRIASIVGQTALTGGTTTQTAFYRGRIIAGAQFSQIGIWNYPTGGPAITLIPYVQAGGLALSR
jgi:hypothetical protein